MMHSYNRQGMTNNELILVVLILVLMDDALVQIKKVRVEGNERVLILVLMDDALVLTPE